MHNMFNDFHFKTAPASILMDFLKEGKTLLD